MATKRRTRGRVAWMVGLSVAAVTAFVAGWAFSAPRGALPLSCIPRIGNCAIVSGRVLHVSTRDSDGDGDMHLLLASSTSITGPLLTVVKIPPAAQPGRRPPLMTWVSVRGYETTGGHGERELHARSVRYGLAERPRP